MVFISLDFSINQACFMAHWPALGPITFIWVEGKWDNPQHQQRMRYNQQKRGIIISVMVQWHHYKYETDTINNGMIFMSVNLLPPCSVVLISSSFIKFTFLDFSIYLILILSIFNKETNSGNGVHRHMHGQGQQKSRNPAIILYNLVFSTCYCPLWANGFSWTL